MITCPLCVYSLSVSGVLHLTLSAADSLQLKETLKGCFVPELSLLLRIEKITIHEGVLF